MLIIVTLTRNPGKKYYVIREIGKIILFFATSIVLIYFGSKILKVRQIVEDYLGDESACHDQFGDADSATEKAEEVLCTLYCLAHENYIKDYANGLTNSRSYKDKGTKNVFFCDPCLAIQEVNQDQQEDIIQWVEETWKLR